MPKAFASSLLKRGAISVYPLYLLRGIDNLFCESVLGIRDSEPDPDQHVSGPPGSFPYIVNVLRPEKMLDNRILTQNFNKNFILRLQMMYLWVLSYKEKI